MMDKVLFRQKGKILKILIFQFFMDEIIPLYNFPIALKCITYPVSYNKESRIGISIIIFLLFLISDLIVRIIAGSIGFVISYQIYYTYGARKTGGYSWGMCIIQNIHIHHWLSCSICFTIFWILGIANPFITGLCFGGITHGIQFSDWNTISKVD